MEKSFKKKIYLIFGILLMILDIILLIDFYIVGTIMGLVVLLTFVIGTLRKNFFKVRFMKLWIVLLFMFFMLNPNPIHWNTQFSRRWMDNREKLIERNHPVLPLINTTFQNWYYNEYGIEFDKDSGFEQRLRRIDEYIREELFEYTLDQYNYGGYMDHIASMDEIIASNDSKGKMHDDCDGISIFTASFLLFMGYQLVYIEEVTYHYHVLVYLPNTNPDSVYGYENAISLYKGRVLAENDKQGYYIFNETNLIIPPTRPIYLSVLEILIDGNVWKFDITELFSGKLIGLNDLIGSTYSSVLMFVLIYLALILLIIGLMYLLKAGIIEKNEFKLKKYKKTLIICSSMIFLCLFINNIFANYSLYYNLDLTFLCNPLLIIVLSAILFIMNKDIENKQF